MAQQNNAVNLTAEKLYDLGYRNGGVWQEREISCTAEGCNIPKTGKPFTSTPGFKSEGAKFGKARTVRAGERDGKPVFAPALWVSIKEPLNKDGTLNVVCQYHSAKELRTARQSRVEELLSCYADELQGSNQKERESSAWRRAAGEIQLYVPLYYVLGRLDQLVRAEEDDIEAAVLGSEDDLIVCAVCKERLTLGQALALERVRQERTEWFVLANLVERAAERPDIMSDVERSMLSSLMDIANPPRGEKRGVQPVHVCKGCGDSILGALNFGRRTMTFADDEGEREVPVFVRATTVVRRMKGAELRRQEGQQANRNRAAASWAKLGEVMGHVVISDDDDCAVVPAEKAHLAERQSSGRGKRRGGKGRNRPEPQEA